MKKSLMKVLSVLASTSMVAMMLGGCGVRTTGSAQASSTPTATGSDATSVASSASNVSGSGDSTSGEITVYTALEDDIIQKYLTSFYAKYPNMKLNIVRDSTGTIIAKAIAEKDNPVADVIWGTSASVLLQLDKYNLIKGYTPKDADKILDQFKDTSNADEKWTGIDAYETAFLVNTDVCKKEGIKVPTSFADLLDSMYKGKIVMPDPTSSGTGMLTVNGILQTMGDDKGWDYLSKLNDNIAAYTTSGSKPAKMAAAGECAVGISFGYRCAQLYQEGNPVQVVFPTEKSGWDVEANCLINKANICPAAYTFLDWAVSDDAMQAYSTEYPITGRGVINAIPDGYSKDPMSNLCDLDLTKAAEDRDSILDKFTPFLAGKVSSD